MNRKPDYDEQYLERFMTKAFRGKETARGIYGIYLSNNPNKILYVGKTSRNFQVRYEEHCIALRDEVSEKYEMLNTFLREESARTGDKTITLEMRVLIDIDLIKCDQKLYERDLEIMEMGLINCFHSPANIQGIRTDYPLIKLYSWD